MPKLCSHESHLSLNIWFLPELNHIWAFHRIHSSHHYCSAPVDVDRFLHRAKAHHCRTRSSREGITHDEEQMGTAYVVSRLPEQEIGSLGSTAVVPNLMGTAWATLEGCQHQLLCLQVCNPVVLLLLQLQTRNKHCREYSPWLILRPYQLVHV